MTVLTWLAVGLAAALAARWVYQRVRPEPLLYVRIEIRPDGHTSVDATPSAAPPQLLAVTALCYLAKIRWLLGTEPPDVLSAFKELVGQAFDFWPEEAG